MPRVAYKTYLNLICLAIASIIMAVLAWQYPLYTTFPIGGDASRYVQRAIDVINKPTDIFTNSRYPGTIALVTASSILPFSWPDRFVYLMAFGYITAGLFLGLLVYRISNPYAASIAIVIWGFMTTNLSPSYESGTLGQLWSFPALLLFISQFGNQRIWHSALLLIATFILHPLSALVASLVAIFTSLSLFIAKPSLSTKQKNFLYSFTFLLLPPVTLVALLSFFQGIPFRDFPTSDSYTPLTYYLNSRISSFVFFVPFGLLYIFNRIYKLHILPSLATLSFILLSLLLAYNNFLGIGLYTDRFIIYLMGSLSIASAIGLYHIAQSYFSPTLACAFIIILLFSASWSTWQESGHVYSFYEAPSNYARLHPDEIQAIQWLDKNASGRTVASTQSNRHSEWIPILARVEWAKINDLRDVTEKPGLDYLIIFKHREGIPDFLKNQTPVFQNKGSQVFSL